MRPARDDGKSLIKLLKWRSRKKKKFKKTDLFTVPYRDWIQTEVHDVNSYMTDSEVNWYRSISVRKLLTIGCPVFVVSPIIV